MLIGRRRGGGRGVDDEFRFRFNVRLGIFAFEFKVDGRKGFLKNVLTGRCRGFRHRGCRGDGDGGGVGCHGSCRLRRRIIMMLLRRRRDDDAVRWRARYHDHVVVRVMRVVGVRMKGGGRWLLHLGR